jgi:hypothetical protein
MMGQGTVTIDGTEIDLRDVEMLLEDVREHAPPTRPLDLTATCEGTFTATFEPARFPPPDAVYVTVRNAVVRVPTSDLPRYTAADFDDFMREVGERAGRLWPWPHLCGRCVRLFPSAGAYVLHRCRGRGR